ncbi:LOW QUALITY PROTEIN: hypothetical protein M8C21_006860 [Ambrosia artemisiifolia]|uniref:thymidine kinase n=1 Tax=Ambrosia artemisiifolia TaxID=4212 RepID=A0AAD5C9K9_AMBAR|nr:LOW QUALITY PROTEIN: hypothetical protein M8C21_006860 [Ambrosia artemisiifolia]
MMKSLFFSSRTPSILSQNLIFKPNNNNTLSSVSSFLSVKNPIFFGGLTFLGSNSSLFCHSSSNPDGKDHCYQPEGEIQVIVGPMFAGKTTTLLRRIKSERYNGSHARRYVQKGLEEMGLNLYDEMRRSGLRPDQFTFASGVCYPGYVRESCTYDGRLVFNKSSDKNVITWTSLISGYGQHGRVKEVLECFHRMTDEGFRPNNVTFLAVLTACSHGGLVKEGRNYFRSMKKDYGIQPGEKHYAAMVDILGRSGKLDEAYEFVKNAPCKRHPVIWGALLQACKWSNVAEIRSGLKELGMKKEPGYSMIEVQKKWHVGEPVNVAIIKSSKDTRYALDSIVTHDGEKLPCWPLTALSSFKERIGLEEYHKLEVIGIDEAQFFDDLYDFCVKAADHDGKTVIVAGLDGDYLRRSFGVLDIIPIADSVTKLKARCELCGKPASFTLRKTDETERELVAGADVYMPVCRHHYATGQVVKETARTVLQKRTLHCGSL